MCFAKSADRVVISVDCFLGVFFGGGDKCLHNQKGNLALYMNLKDRNKIGTHFRGCLW